LKKVLQKIEQIKRARSGSPNFESHDAESCDLQLAIGQYIRLRGTTRVCGKLDNLNLFTWCMENSHNLFITTRITESPAPLKYVIVL
jgi:hypothetical protein